MRKAIRSTRHLLKWVVDNYLTATGVTTLTNKTLTAPVVTAPVITSPDVTMSVATHNYGGEDADWTLNAAEGKNFILRATNAGDAVNAIVADTANKPYLVINGTGKTLTVKTEAGSGIEIANDKVAMVMSDGTNVIRLTGDA